MQETWVQSLSWEDPLEKGAATHSSILAWRIPWTEELGRLYSPLSRKELYMTDPLSHTHTHTHTALYEALCSDVARQLLGPYPKTPQQGMGSHE